MVLYRLVGYIYSFALKLASFFYPKAKKIVLGRTDTWLQLQARLSLEKRYIWMHASSLGEFEQGRPFMERLRWEHPDIHIVLTFFSPSGYEVRKEYEGADIVVYLPSDTKKSARRFLEIVNPEMAFFVKYDFWPSFLLELKRRRVPTFLISGIFRREQLFFKWYGKAYLSLLECFTTLYLQNDASQELLAKYGIANTVVCGDTRFDRVIEIREQSKSLPLVEAFSQSSKGFVLVAGSSWPLDEDLLLHYFDLRSDLKLIIAPHEVNESRISALMARIERPAVRLSEAKIETIANFDCLIVDCYGVLASIYRYGHFAYIGGGFGHGIHNTLEAAVYGKPVFFGPKHQKFAEAVALLENGGAFSVEGADDLVIKMDELLSSKAKLELASSAAYRYIHDNAGATNAILKAVSTLL